MDKNDCPPSYLAWTAVHHRAAGSTVPKVLQENPGKTLAQTMSAAEIGDYLNSAVESVTYCHTVAKSGDQNAIHFLHIVRTMLSNHIAYLQDIGRLPAQWKGYDPQVVFALESN